MRLRGDTRVHAALATVAVGAVALASAPASAPAQELELEPFGGRDFNNPYYVASPPGDPHRVFVLEGAGTIWLVKDGVTLPTPFADLTSQVLALNEEGCGECGLYSIAFAPDYAQSGLLYAFYTADIAAPGYDMRVEELRRSAADPDTADPSSRRPILELPGGLYHSGGQLQFGPDGFLYVTTGDNHFPELPQDTTSLYGKLLRIDPRGSAPGQYSAPAGNPFFDGAGPQADAVYAYGLRNPYRFSFDRSTGDLALGDVGSQAWEEINFLPEGAGRGRNFGWPCFEGSLPHVSAPPSCTPPPSNHTPPTVEWEHPLVGSTAVITGYVVRDPSLPALFGRLIYANSGDALNGAIRSIRLSPGIAPDDADTGLEVPAQISFGQDACGHVYVTSFNDRVYRVEPSVGPLACKLAPGVGVGLGRARHAARRRAIVLRVRCDEDCDARAKGVIRVRRAPGSRAFSIKLKPATRRLQLTDPRKLKLALSRRAARRLRTVLGSGRRAIARVRVAATGGGGGSRVVKRSIRQRP